MKRVIYITLLSALGVIYITSCNDNPAEYSGKSILNVRLTDAPGDYKAVYIDLQEIQVHVSNDMDSGWVSLDNINAGVYDLLKLTNGVDTLLGENEIPSGKLSQIRLILGDRNSLIDGEDSVGLKTPSAQQSGLKLKVNATLEKDFVYNVLLDFDAAQSVVKAGNSGNYILKPVIRTLVDLSTGSVKGTVLPDSIQSAVFAVHNDDSISTYTNHGNFLIKGLTPDTYNIYIDPGADSGFRDSTITNVNVNIGEVTQIGEIMLYPGN